MESSYNISDESCSDGDEYDADFKERIVSKIKEKITNGDLGDEEVKHMDRLLVILEDTTKYKEDLIAQLKRRINEAKFNDVQIEAQRLLVDLLEGNMTNNQTVMVIDDIESIGVQLAIAEEIEKEDVAERAIGGKDASITAGWPKFVSQLKAKLGAGSSEDIFIPDTVPNMSSAETSSINRKRDRAARSVDNLDEEDEGR